MLKAFRELKEDLNKPLNELEKTRGKDANIRVLVRGLLL